MRTKRKLLALLSALSITASAFAGFAVPASADDDSAVTNVAYQDGNIAITADAEQSAAVIIAKYDNGVLKSAEIKEVTLTAEGVNNISCDLEGEDAKIFVWDGLNTMKPLYESVPVASAVETPGPTAEPTADPTPDPTEAPTAKPTINPADVIYSQDYEEVSAASETWTAGSYTDGLTIGTDSTKYVQFTNGSQSGNRGAWSLFDVDLSEKEEYVVEFDLAVTPQSGYDSTSQFAIMTGTQPGANNSIAFSNCLFLMEIPKASTVATINGVSDATLTYPSGGWCHYTVYADKNQGLASLTVENSSTGAVILDKLLIPINGSITKITGAFMCIGRGNGTMKLDNIIVRDTNENDEFGERGEETLSEVTFVSQINQLISQPAENEPVHLPVQIKATGNYGSDLTDVVDIEWSTTGLGGEDGYISLTKEEGTDAGTSGESPNGSASAYFNVRNGVSNWFGNVVAKVTYGEKTLEISTPFAVTGASDSGTNIAPKAGYYESMSSYADDLVGYTATANSVDGQDLVLDNWSIYGSNGARTLTLNKDEDGTKYLRFASNGGSGSTVGVYQLANQSTQYIVDMKVRFTGGDASLGHYEYTPNNGGSNSNWAVSYSGGALKVGTQTISGLNGTDWFRVIVSADESAQTYWVKVYNNNGDLVGEVDAESLNAANATSSKGDALDPATPAWERDQVYFCLAGTFPIDVASFKIYYPTTASITIDGGDGVIQVPEATEAGTDTTTEDLTAVLTDTDGFNMTGTVIWSLDDEYTGVEIESTGTQTATLTVDESASAGTVTVVASYGSARCEKEVTLSTSGNSIAFTSSTTSMTIPFEGEDDVTANFAAEARNKGGEVINTDNGVTLTLVDAQGNAYTNENITFVDGVLTVKAGAPSKTLYIKAEASVTADGETENLSSKVKVNIHGLSFSFGTDAPTDEAYTQVTTEAYSDKVGYGFADATVVTANADNVTGTANYRFKAKVPNGNYVVNVTTSSSSIISEVVETVTATTGITKSGSSFNVAVCDGVLDLTFASGSTLSALTINQAVAKTAQAKPSVYAIGDSTTKNGGNGISWGEVASVENYDNLSSFSNNGMAGRDSVNFYNEGRVETVLLSICPGDYVTVNMGINSKEANEAASYYTLIDEYYVQGIIQRGGIPVILTATPQGPVGDHVGNYSNGVFNCNRGTGAHNGDLRKIAQKYDLNIIELGYWGDEYFNSLTAEDAANAGYSTVLELVQSWYPDHNHYTTPFANVVAEHILTILNEIAGGSSDYNQAKDPHISEQ